MGKQEDPKEDCPALLYIWSGSVLSRSYFSSVEDHIPVREWILRHKEESLIFALLLCGDWFSCDFEKRYAFLDGETYTRYF